jgi:Flp pilus assembly protein TadG
MFTGRRQRERGQSLTELALILPILIVLLLATADFARLLNTMITIESAAREAADYATLYPWQWDPTDPPDNRSNTIATMERRACIAASFLPEYEGTEDTCSNPSFAYEIDTGDAGVAANQCHTIPRNSVPCNVIVTLTYRFDLIAPVGLLGLPPSFVFERPAVFAMADFEIDQL